MGLAQAATCFVPSPRGIVLGHHVTVTFQDVETLDLDDFQHNSFNLTSVRLVKRGSGFVADMLLQMESYESTLLKDDLHILNSSGVISVRRNSYLLRTF